MLMCQLRRSGKTLKYSQEDYRLEVPNLLDYTLLREPRRGVAGLADVGRDGCRWSDRECYSAGVVEQCEASKLQQCERHESVAPVQDGTKRCAMVRDAMSCCSSA